MSTRKPGLGLFKVEEIAEKVLATGNHLRLGLKNDPANKDQIRDVKIVDINTGKEINISAYDLVQAALAVQRIDRTKLFICAFHGSYVAQKATKQDATCPKCHSMVVQAAAQRGGSFDQDDA